MIPTIGLGTWQMTGRTCVEAVRHALEIGYRHIDTAAMYGNEDEVGEGMRLSDVRREEIFLASKIWHDNLEYDQVLGAIEASRNKLGVSVIDLMYVHWPSPEGKPLEPTMRALNEAREQGLIKAIGVSNFTPELFEQATELAPIAALQVERHPYLPQEELVERCQTQGTTLVSYCPLARASVLEDPTLRAIGEAHQATPAQVTLAWLLSEPGCAAIPKSSHAERRQENLEALTLQLTDEEVAVIDGIERRRRLIDPGFAPEWRAGLAAK